MSSTTNIHLNGDGCHRVEHFPREGAHEFVTVEISPDPRCSFAVFIDTREQADALVRAFVAARDLLPEEAQATPVPAGVS